MSASQAATHIILYLYDIFNIISLFIVENGTGSHSLSPSLSVHFASQVGTLFVGFDVANSTQLNFNDPNR